MTTAPSRSRKARAELNFNLVENGIDFIQSGIEQYFLRDTPRARDHKYAVLHIFAGVLLLLKERLRRAHPSLIFARVEDAAKDVTKEDVKNVAFDQAVDRLKVCADVRIPPDQMATLRSAQRVRNQLEHYEVALNLKQTQEIVGRLCEFVYLFMRDELQADLGDHLKGAVWHRVQELRGIAKALEEERAAEWRERAKKYVNLPPWRLAKLRDSLQPYHPKPFAFSELLARVRTVLRRGPQRQPDVVRVADLEIDLIRHRATRAGERLDLTPKEFGLLSLLARRAGEVLSRTLIAEHVWDVNFASDTNVVDCMFVVFVQRSMTAMPHH